MKINSRHTGVSKQDGFVLIVLVVVILLAISSYYFSTISLVEVQTNRIEKTQVVLKRAKQALLGYAQANWQVLGNAGKVGQLPCPDYKEDGDAGIQDATDCGTDFANAIGYFPWRTLGLEITKDSSGSCLLYVVSPAYKNGTAVALNPDSYGQLQIVDSVGAVIQGVLPEDRPVAVIIAPGPALPNQTRVDENNPLRPCGSYYADNLPNLLAAYLDNDGNTNNAAIDKGVDNVMDTLVAKYADSDKGINPVNDRIITITYREFWGINANPSANTLLSAINAPNFGDRMNDLTEAIALCFAEYGDRNSDHLPMPAPRDINGGDYRRSVDYDDSGDFTAAYAGRLPFDVSRANTVLPDLVPSNENHIYNNSFCDGLPITTLGENVNFSDELGTEQGEYRELLENWKDHFFYVVSKEFRPDRAGAASSCLAANCVEYNGIRYAALIIYSGLKMGGQLRHSTPFDVVDEKSVISNYLEQGREAVFPDDAGNSVYPVVDINNSNDFVVCIKDDMSVTLAC